MKDIIIDTDPGHDDALAIMLASKSNMFNINAITTVAGNSNIENTTRNTRYILELLHKDIPVYSGSEKPIERDLHKAFVHGENGLEGLDPKNEPNLTKNGVERIISMIENRPHKITLITLGPLSNIAKAIQKRPQIMSKLKEVIIMGGAINVPGNQNRVAEFNMYTDPEAADIVFRFPIKKILVPLDACNHIRLSIEDFEKISDESLKNPILSMIRPYMRNVLKEVGVKGVLMYDPLTVYSLMNPNVCKKRDYNILIEKKGDLTRGMTVPESRKSKKPQPNITVVENLPKNDFKETFIKTISLHE